MEDNTQMLKSTCLQDSLTNSKDIFMVTEIEKEGYKIEHKYNFKDHVPFPKHEFKLIFNLMFKGYSQPSVLSQEKVFNCYTPFIKFLYK